VSRKISESQIAFPALKKAGRKYFRLEENLPDGWRLFMNLSSGSSFLTKGKQE